MKSRAPRFAALLAILLPLLCAGVQAQHAGVAPATLPARFVALDLFVDSGTSPLAAWQVELTATHGNPQIVGVESGGSRGSVYRDPPYYDPAALMTGRIILASYTTSDSPPSGKVHVARLHLRIEGEYDFAVKAMAAADPQEHSLKVTATVSPLATTQASDKKE